MIKYEDKTSTCITKLLNSFFFPLIFFQSDVWALGCCVYEMATLKHAFNAKDMNSLAYRIIEGKVKMYKIFLSVLGLSSNLRQLFPIGNKYFVYCVQRHILCKTGISWWYMM